MSPKEFSHPVDLVILYTDVHVIRKPYDWQGIQQPTRIRPRRYTDGSHSQEAGSEGQLLQGKGRPFVLVMKCLLTQMTPELRTSFRARPASAGLPVQLLQCLRCRPTQVPLSVPPGGHERLLRPCIPDLSQCSGHSSTRPLILFLPQGNDEWTHCGRPDLDQGLDSALARVCVGVAEEGDERLDGPRRHGFPQDVYSVLGMPHLDQRPQGSFADNWVGLVAQRRKQTPDITSGFEPINGGRARDSM